MQQPTRSDANALLAFESEGSASVDAVPRGPVHRQLSGVSSPISARRVLVALVTTAAVVVSLLALRRASPTAQAGAIDPRPGTLTIDTRPSGSPVVVDGQRRGLSPLSLAVPAGEHTIEIGTGSAGRVVRVAVAAGAEVSQYFDVPTPVSAPTAGRLSIVTDPPGARVLVDGRPRGVAPVVVSDMTPEEHRIAVASDTGTVERVVNVPAGATASVTFSLSKASGPLAGWLSIAAPFDVDVIEHDEVIGNSGANRILLTAGRHDLVLANRTLGYEGSQRIDVTAGRTATIRVEAPKGTLNVNARPWAEIIVDGTSVGETPIANLQLAIGQHEVVFRHPQFGERRETAIVTVKGPNRVAADLTK